MLSPPPRDQAIVELKHEAQRQPLAGIALMIAAFACFAVLDAIAKALMPLIGTGIVVFGRYAFALLFVGAWLWQQGGLPLLRTRHPTLQVARGLLLVLSTASNFIALNYLQLAQTSAISFSNPLWVCALSPLLLGERIGSRRWVAVVVGFLGVLLIIRPGSADFHWAMTLSVAGALFTALYQIATRKVGANDRVVTSLFYVSLIGAIAAAPVAPFAKAMPTVWQWVVLAFMGLFASFGHYMLTHAHRMAPAPVLAPFVYTQILWMVLFGYLVFGDIPDLYTIVGGAVVIAMGLYVFYRERQSFKARGKEGT